MFPTAPLPPAFSDRSPSVALPLSFDLSCSEVTEQRLRAAVTESLRLCVVHIPLSDREDSALRNGLVVSDQTTHSDAAIDISTGPHLQSESASASWSSAASDPVLLAAPLPTESVVHRHRVGTTRAARHREIDSVRRGREAVAFRSLRLLLDSFHPQEARVFSRQARHGNALAVEQATTELQYMRQQVHDLQGQLRHLQSQLTPRLNRGLFVAYETLFRGRPNQHTLIFSHESRLCMDVSDDFCDFTGYARDEIVGRTVPLCPTLFNPRQLGTIDFWVEGSLTSSDVDAQIYDNWLQMMRLLRGQQPIVYCMFPVIMSDRRRLHAQFRCWISAGQRDEENMLIVQTSRESYQLSDWR